MEYFPKCPRCDKQLTQSPIEHTDSVVVLECYCENCNKYYTFYLDFYKMECHSISKAGRY